ncbi:hypothetical protein B0A48_05141 [Cryoendolithus antarcticus]|uniref:Heterokaryon incompatibility domain-containing protein n=1 Tax=Cryoendolithus antarcticus TaxID=1507870 RepID=A0A1V8TEP7_9PEZI|nr:hypothetical protein B0A48_05141 [Cryoendolithus antarcticus]
MRSGLPLAQLSGDVAAGIKWTRALGFQYIWIDTLCVLQDSYQDWLTEAQQMADIYRHSWCTLAASDGAQPNVPMGASFQPGIWSEPDDEPVGSMRAIGGLTGRKENSIPAVGSTKKRSSLVEWSISTSFPRGFPPKELVGEAQASIALTGDKSQQRRQAVTRYSTRHLTFGKDKLIAFAGIVAYLQSDDWYHAGLWGHDVVRQLLWSVAGHTQMNGKDVCYCPDAKVPSWSWANVDAMIDYEEHYYSKTDRQLTHHVDMISADPATLELCVIIPDVDEGGDEYPFKVPPELRYLYMQSESEAPDGTTSLRCLALLAVPGRQGFFVRFGVARADTAEACAYFDDEKNRCGETAYMPNECGALTIV